MHNTHCCRSSMQNNSTPDNSVIENTLYEIFIIMYIFVHKLIVVPDNNNNTIIHFIETRLQYNWHNNKNADGLINRLARSMVILNQAHTVSWLIGQCDNTAHIDATKCCNCWRPTLKLYNFNHLLEWSIFLSINNNMNR